jgi:hypothetical protein
MPKSTYHMSVNLEGLLRHYKRKKINIITDDNGRQLSDAEARLHIHNLMAQGHKLMCCSNNCEGFDPFEKGCLGHAVPDDATEG